MYRRRCHVWPFNITCTSVFPRKNGGRSIAGIKGGGRNEEKRAGFVFVACIDPETLRPSIPASIHRLWFRLRIDTLIPAISCSSRSGGRGARLAILSRRSRPPRLLRLDLPLQRVLKAGMVARLGSPRLTFWVDEHGWRETLDCIACGWWRRHGSSFRWCVKVCRNLSSNWLACAVLLWFADLLCRVSWLLTRAYLGKHFFFI